ncbi:PH domain-containing protein DDB_G0287875-like [Anastrepha obliqua]|uniref:PH domain-containing protein DDB_G0287875-like n=1 Tax=Anastrepha obliqua TaxID=95512 RepID=UPI0024097610|nr:PH domain-containing protein DDB_G0287875-like [Anastrepha obliqua]
MGVLGLCVELTYTLQILRPSVAVAVAVGCFALFLAPCCLAAAIDAEGLPQELLVPFNDLLPPLPDAEFEQGKTTSTTTKPTTTTTTTKTTTTTTTKAPTTKTTTITTTTRAPTTKTSTTTPRATLAPSKPTKAATAQQLKKTQYQQQQSQQLAVPALDLNPEVPPLLSETETPAAPVKVIGPKQTASTQHLQHVQAAQTQYQTLQQHLQPQKVQQQKQQFAKQLLQQPQIQHKLQPQAAATINKVAPKPQQSSSQAQRQVDVEQLQQYLEYIYHPTTRRPSRGALPTLTPFPRHFK